MKYPCVIIASDIFCSSKYFPKHARWIRCSKIKKIVDTIFFNPNVCRMFVPEHKHPLMSTRNRLHVFPVDDAGALACSGLLWSGDGYTSPERCGLKSKTYVSHFSYCFVAIFIQILIDRTSAGVVIYIRCGKQQRTKCWHSTVGSASHW